MKKNEILQNQVEGQVTSLSCRLVEAFWTFWPAFQRWTDAQAASQDTDLRLTPQRTRILAILSEQGPQIMAELRDQLGVTATNITALVDALENEGLVARKSHPTDRRATVVEITPKAASKLGACCNYREKISELFKSLPEGDREDLLRIMQTLKARLGDVTH